MRSLPTGSHSSHMVGSDLTGHSCVPGFVRPSQTRASSYERVTQLLTQGLLTQDHTQLTQILQKPRSEAHTGATHTHTAHTHTTPPLIKGGWVCGQCVILKYPGSRIVTL